ncbi:diaminopimelate epimerase [Corynebacterium kutscheri]|uniref:Diaminopimelate epimerase n=1 Tax=Corynebacterium kutscheri TaxID=35755 RepID=A0A0F6R252_9CORY|nr:diaminopimelate epimerase [Corynebacterium kutscheri]VEH08680.1 diaminopimelate epimerase [Corynebacterium kutscheri]VEH09727.1 diaminopimelate epimerase [Corynebacterium kutscheri]VEH79810.1 diaminopimelate epimerase [Corynebacterium kutscheri]
MVLNFAKGHGTENDFVIVEDLDAHYDLSAEKITLLCDRRAGIGADGLLRVVRAGALVNSGMINTLDEGISDTDLFMDYYNADGSIAEMCGNGARVFAHWVFAQNLVNSEQFVIGTRAGAKTVTVHSCDDKNADISVNMGSAEVMGVSTCIIGDKTFAGLGVNVGNPHLACIVPNLSSDDLTKLFLTQPVFDPEFFPAGVNVEIATEITNGATSMRVYERGVGETRSCGTGTVATALAALADQGNTEGVVEVHVPGGTVIVTIDANGSVLRGPSKIVARGTTSLI